MCTQHLQESDDVTDSTCHSIPNMYVHVRIRTCHSIPNMYVRVRIRTCHSIPNMYVYVHVTVYLRMSRHSFVLVTAFDMHGNIICMVNIYKSLMKSHFPRLHTIMSTTITE